MELWFCWGTPPLPHPRMLELYSRALWALFTEQAGIGLME